MSSFKLRIEINSQEIITLDRLISSDILIRDLKTIIADEQGINIFSKMTLKYNDVIMEDDKTLINYNITNENHVISATFKKKSIHKYGFFGRHKESTKKSSVMSINSGMNPSDPSTYQTSLLSQYPRNNTICNNIIYITFGIIRFSISLIILGISLYGIITPIQEYQSYTQNMSSCDDINALCNNNCDKFNAFTGYHFIITAILNGFVWLLLLMLCQCHQFGCYKNSKLSKNGIKIAILMVILFVLAMIGWNTVITWIDIGNIWKYCDKNTQFYHDMIHRWSIWNYMYTLMIYCLLPCFCWISGYFYCNV